MGNNLHKSASTSRLCLIRLLYLNYYQIKSLMNEYPCGIQICPLHINDQFLSKKRARDWRRLACRKGGMFTKPHHYYAFKANHRHTCVPHLIWQDLNPFQRSFILRHKIQTAHDKRRDFTQIIKTQIRIYVYNGHAEGGVDLFCS